MSQGPKPSPTEPSNPLHEATLEELRRLNHNLELFNRKRRRLVLSFGMGITRGLGAAFGATIVFALLLGIAARMVSVPIVGGYVRQIVDFVQAQQPHPTPE